MKLLCSRSKRGQAARGSEPDRSIRRSLATCPSVQSSEGRPTLREIRRRCSSAPSRLASPGAAVGEIEVRLRDRPVERDRVLPAGAVSTARLGVCHRSIVNDKITEVFVAAILGQFALAVSSPPRGNEREESLFQHLPRRRQGKSTLKNVSVYPSHARTRKSTNGRWRISPGGAFFNRGSGRGLPTWAN